MFDSVIFDVDGTLWDSTPIVEKAWNRALEESGFSENLVTADRLKGLFGLPMPDIINAILPGVEQIKKDEFETLCYSYEHEYLEKDMAYLYPGICETIRELAKKYRVFIVSNCQAGYIELFIKKTGLADVIVDHLCLGDTNLLKADNIRLIVERNNLKSPVYVGDIQGDADAADKAGVEFIHAAYGFGSVEKSYAVINEPKELLDVMEK